MARRGNLGSWAYGGAPAQGTGGMPHKSDAQVASGFKSGIDQATNDPIQTGNVPGLGGSTVRSDVNPGVWGRGCKCP